MGSAADRRIVSTKNGLLKLIRTASERNIGMPVRNMKASAAHVHGLNSVASSATDTRRMPRPSSTVIPMWKVSRIAKSHCEYLMV